MPTKTKIAIAAALIVASASPSLAASSHRNAYAGTPGWSQGSGGGFVPYSEAEHEWFARASRPSNL